MKKKQREEKNTNKSSFEIRENKTLIAEAIGAVIVLGLIVILLTHACGITKYTVTFESNGGTAVTSQKVIENNKASSPNSPTKKGYNFEGWYYNDVVFDFNTKITANIKLEARWTESAPINPDLVSGISLEQTEIFLAPKGVFTLVVNIKPDTALDQTVSWSSSDTSVAAVDQNGKVTGVGVGSATITVVTNDGEFTATANITVTNDNIPVVGVTLNKTTLNLGTGKNEILKATINPAGATNTGLTWSSSDAAIVTVDQSGKVTTKKAGSATITVTTKDGNKTATCKVTVKDIPVTGITLNKTTVSLVEGAATTLTANIKPTDATNKGLTWSSSDTSVATVDQNGKITAKKVGTTTITVTTKDGNKTAKCIVTVTEKTYKYTYKTEGISAGGGQIVEYKLFIYKDGVNITSQVTAVTNPSTRQYDSVGGYYKISSNYTGTVTFTYEGKTLTASKS